MIAGSKSYWHMATAASARDADFSSVVAEMLSTPPAPIRLRLMLVICALFSVVLIGCWIARLDIYAVAPARVQPAGRSKVVQPLETGRVISIYVENGELVRAGQLLVELDQTETAAEREVSQAQLDAVRAEIFWRKALLASIRSGLWEEPAKLAEDADIDHSEFDRERSVYMAELSLLRSTMAALDAKAAEGRARREALGLTIQAQEELLSTLRERVNMQRTLLERMLGSKAAVNAAEQEFNEELRNLANQKGERLTADALVLSVLKQKESVIAQHTADGNRALADAQSREKELEQRLIQTSARVRHTEVIAPIDGVVQDLAVTTIGQVVAPAQRLMTIVPEAAVLELEARVANRDIGFVRVGQDVVIKVDAFPFVRYGTLKGRVSRIAHDSINALDVDPLGGRNVTANEAFVSAQSMIFLVTIVLDEPSVMIDGTRVPLIAGMSATAEIKTGERRVIDYFLGPLLETASEGAHER